MIDGVNVIFHHIIAIVMGEEVKRDCNYYEEATEETTNCSETHLCIAELCSQGRGVDTTSVEGVLKHESRKAATALWQKATK